MPWAQALSARGSDCTEMRTGTFPRGHSPARPTSSTARRRPELKNRRARFTPAWIAAAGQPFWNRVWSSRRLTREIWHRFKWPNWQSVRARCLPELQYSGLSSKNSASPITAAGLVIDETRRLVSLCLQPLAVRVGDALGQLLLSDTQGGGPARHDPAGAADQRLRPGAERSPEPLRQHRHQRPGTRRGAPWGCRAGLDGDDLLQPVNVETVDQAQARATGPMPHSAAAAAQAANSNVAASLLRAFDGMRPLAVDVAGSGKLERCSVVAKLEDGREVVVDLADIRKALAVDTMRPPPNADPALEAAE